MTAFEPKQKGAEPKRRALKSIDEPSDQAAAFAPSSFGTEAMVFRICEAIW